MMLILKKLITILCFAAILFQLSCNDNPSDSAEQNLSLLGSSQLPQGHHFYSAQFINDNTGWAVGKNGAIYKMTNKSTGWQAQNSGTTDDLVKVQFIDSLTGWAAGANSLLFTSDGGANWQVKLSNVPFSVFLDMYFYDKNTGWVSGSPDGKIYHTDDAGNTWSVQQTDTMGRVTDISFVDRNNGYSLTNISGLYKTTDGGLNWIIMTRPRFCNTISFFNMNTGYAGNNIMPSSVMPDQAKIFVTHDGGSSWSEQSISAINPEAVWKVAFMNSSTGFAIAGGISSFTGEAKDFVEIGELIYSVNGGNQWASVEIVSSDNAGIDFRNVVDFTFYEKNKLCVLTLDGKVYQISLVVNTEKTYADPDDLIR